MDGLNGRGHNQDRTQEHPRRGTCEGARVARQERSGRRDGKEEHERRLPEWRAPAIGPRKAKQRRGKKARDEREGPLITHRHHPGRALAGRDRIFSPGTGRSGN